VIGRVAALSCLLLSPLAAQTPPSGPVTYVGVETCKLCHEEVVSNLSTNPHHVLEVNEKKGWKGKTCEACHGPGSRHADSADPKDIRNPA
jgi:hypothetical protein